MKCWTTPSTKHLAGYCTQIEIRIHVDGSISVIDNGRGIPVDIHPKFGIPAVELVLTNLHAGGKFGQGAYKYSGGLHGVGAKCVNALSDRFKAEVRRNGKRYVNHLRARAHQGEAARRRQLPRQPDRHGHHLFAGPDHLHRYR